MKRIPGLSEALEARASRRGGAPSRMDEVLNHELHPDDAALVRDLLMRPPRVDGREHVSAKAISDVLTGVGVKVSEQAINSWRRNNRRAG